MTTTTKRNDVHKPSLADPADYTFCAAFYQGTSEWMYEAYASDHDEYDEWVEWVHPDTVSWAVGAAKKPGTRVFQGNYAEKRSCDHCGASFAHGVLFKHTNGDLVHVGHICAGNTIGLPSKAAAVKKKAEKYAAEKKAHAKQMEKTAPWRAENAEVVAWLESLENPHPFLADMKSTLKKWGNLSDRQLAATLKFKKVADTPKPEKAEDPVPEYPVATGKVTMSGKVLTTKWQDSMYGGALKMLVMLSDGNKVWGTVPQSLLSEVANSGAQDASLKGSMVTFTATVEQSKDDEHFGFFKRPTQAVVNQGSWEG